MEAITQKKLDDMTPKQIVEQLDKYVIGQKDAKRTIAVALRNRVRRKRLPLDIRDEVSPKNILMIGPTGVGKTEIARRIAKLSNAPFIKVEATKYTEVGYVGRDVESMVKDLMASAVSMVKEEMAASREGEVEKKVEDRLLDLLLPSFGSASDNAAETRERFREMLKNGVFDNKEVEMRVDAQPSSINIMGGGNMEDLQQAMEGLSSMLGGVGKSHIRKITVKRAREIIKEEEMEKVIDPDKAVDEAKERTEEMGIIFIDEIDKITSRGSSSSNGEVSREGVQRDILPIVEGTKVNTRWGVIDTTNILFIAAGAFSASKPSDLIPELQGRFPLRVELSDLGEEEFYRILSEPKNALTRQYEALLKTEDVQIEFTDDALRELARIAHEVNLTNDNIGARRLHTIMEKLLEELAFSADELGGQTISITKQYVDDRLQGIVEDQDLSKYIL